MHLDAHDQVSLSHGQLTVAQTNADREKPRPGEAPSVEYINALNALVKAAGEYGEAVVTLGKILSWKSSMTQPGERFRL